MTNGNTDPAGKRPAFSALFPEGDVYLMISLLMRYGLRSHEITDLNAASLDPLSGILTIPSRKTMKTREIWLSPAVSGMLAAYLKEPLPARRVALTRLAKLRRFLRWF